MWAGFYGRDGVARPMPRSSNDVAACRMPGMNERDEYDLALGRAIRAYGTTMTILATTAGIALGTANLGHPAIPSQNDRGLIELVVNLYKWLTPLDKAELKELDAFKGRIHKLIDHRNRHVHAYNTIEPAGFRVTLSKTAEPQWEANSMDTLKAFRRAAERAGNESHRWLILMTNARTQRGEEP